MHDMVFNKKKGGTPLLALHCFFQGLKLLAKPGLRKYFMVPVLINLTLFLAAFYLGIYYISDLIHEFIPAWLDWIRWILWPLFFLSFLSIGFFTFTLLANLIAAPFYGNLAAKTLSINRSQAFQANEQTIAKVIFSELKRLWYLLIRALPLVILSFIPIVNLVAPLLWVLFGSWGMALEYMAYPLENEGLLFPEQRQLIKSIRFGALSFGGIVVLGLTIPVLNILVPPAAVIGATLYLEKIKTTKD